MYNDYSKSLIVVTRELTGALQDFMKCRDHGGDAKCAPSDVDFENGANALFAFYEYCELNNIKP